MKIYISIPITGHDLQEQQRTAKDLSERIKSRGHDPVNPFDTPLAPENMSAREQYAYYMGEDLKQLLVCDAIYMSPGWHISRGCMIERTAATYMGLTIFHNISEVPGSAVSDHASSSSE